MTGPCKITTHKWRTSAGYPMIERERQRWLEHRWVYQEKVGELLEGHDIHHKCGNKLCVEPSHLEQLTKAKHHQAHLDTGDFMGGWPTTIEKGYKGAFDAEEEFSKTIPRLHAPDFHFAP